MAAQARGPAPPRRGIDHTGSVSSRPRPCHATYSSKAKRGPRRPGILARAGSRADWPSIGELRRGPAPLPPLTRHDDRTQHARPCRLGIEPFLFRLGPPNSPGARQRFEYGGERRNHQKMSGIQNNDSHAMGVVSRRSTPTIRTTPAIVNALLTHFFEKKPGFFRVSTHSAAAHGA